MAHSQIRVFAYTICVIQLLATIERQIFDFLGYMWLPMLWNFLNIILVILGIFGIWQRKLFYFVGYLIWTFVWIAWNAFILCYYLEAGQLNRKDDLLSFGTKSFSWWLENGSGCRPEYSPNNTVFNEDTFGGKFVPPRPSNVRGCLIEYHIIESSHAGVHLILGLLGLIFGFLFLSDVVKENKKEEANKSIYSIEYSPARENGNIVSNGTLTQDSSDLYSASTNEVQNHPGHMTPRRVKRRSHTRSSARSLGSAPKSNNSSSMNRNRRASTRSNPPMLNKHMKNPVTKLMNTQQQPILGARSPDSSTSNDDPPSHNHPLPPGGPRQLEQYGQINPAYESSRPNSIYSSSVMSGNIGHNLNFNQMNNLQSVRENPSRPPSALTSYSNFHPQRKVMENIGMNNLTQESLLNGNGGAIPKQPMYNNVNSSFDDLPPPPPPITADEGPASTPLPQVPVPQQRNPNPRKNNEYVNMPIASSTDIENNDTQTLRADHHLHNKQPELPPRLHHHHQQQQQQQQYPQRGSAQMRSYRLANGVDEDDYGFAKPHQPNGAMAGASAIPGSGDDPDKWYLKDSMKPVGSSAHGGNCKCYRCQRKLTAI